MDLKTATNRTHWFVNLSDALPISVAVLPRIVDTNIGVRVERGIRHRVLRGPFDVFDIVRKAM
jgi:hypothetical protein